MKEAAGQAERSIEQDAGGGGRKLDLKRAISVTWEYQKVRYQVRITQVTRLDPPWPWVKETTTVGMDPCRASRFPAVGPLEQGGMGHGRRRPRETGPGLGYVGGGADLTYWERGGVMGKSL